MKEAKELAEAFQKKFKTSNKAIYYSMDIFERLMALPESVGIRIYPGLTGDTFTPVLVAVNENGDNIYYNDATTNDATTLSSARSISSLSSMEEKGNACPPYLAGNDFF